MPAARERSQPIAHPRIKGLRYQPEFLSEAEEHELIETIDKAEWSAKGLHHAAEGHPAFDVAALVGRAQRLGSGSFSPRYSSSGLISGARP
jgi:hypothetical protein